MIKYSEILVIITLIMMSAALTYLIFENDKLKPSSNSIEQIIDTVFVKLPPIRTQIDKIPARLEHRTLADTNELSFIALSDTIVSSDTISIIYSYPENNFSFSISRGIDSIMVRNITNQTQIYRNENWWENPLYVLLGFIFGVITAQI